MIKIGVLLPNAHHYPYLGNHYVSGLRLALNTEKVEHEIHFESIGSGTRTESILEKAQKLFIQSGVQVLIVYAGNKVAKALTELAEANRRLIYFSNLGTSSAPSLKSPYLICNTFELWESAWLSGKMCGENQSKVFMVSDFYDSGFQFAHGFESGLKHTKGEIVGYNISQDGWEKSTLESLIEQASEANSLYTTISNPGLNKFLQGYSELSTDLELVAGGITHLGSLQKNTPEINLRGHISWLKELDIEVNQKFVSAYKKENAELPSIFSQMGHEAGLILNSQKALGAFNNRDGFISDGFSIDSSRGPLNFMKDRMTVLAPQYYYEMEKKGESEDKLIVMNKVSQSETLLKAKREKREGNDSGWLNPYPCD